MTLVFKNIQSATKLKIPRIRSEIQILRRILKIEQYDIAVLLVTNKYMETINKTYRNCQGPTDVLSFRTVEEPLPDQPLYPLLKCQCGDDLSLGDILLAPAYMQQQCLVNNDNFHNVLMTTVTHGMCHLLGFDHQTKMDQQKMMKMESETLTAFNRLTGCSCIPLTALGC